ncbi:hypothetical protein M231_00782 [Tremella mesenterica]|uniref:Uncharacterized protein n=1 Tax=Tremella mesenterica TaxID=5217 RepID=A0A4Q1BVE6_TREME|nr:hypothetical protein M231_00782 [Tremella mesenterica]
MICGPWIQIVESLEEFWESLKDSLTPVTLTSPAIFFRPISVVRNTDSGEEESGWEIIPSLWLGPNTLDQAAKTQLISAMLSQVKDVVQLIAETGPSDLDKEDIVNQTIMAVRACCKARSELLEPARNFTTLVGRALSRDDPSSHGDPKVVKTERVKVLGDRNRIGTVRGEWVQAWPDEET